VQPELSVIVPTVKPWPRTRGALRALEAQARATHSEIIVADGHGAGIPSDLEAPFVPLRIPGADVFELRAAGCAAARGDVVALLEDHLTVAPDWCLRVIKAFDEHPHAGGIVGVADNGAPKLLDRASFLLTWAPFLAPLGTVPLDRCPPPGVVAYRRRDLAPTAAPPVPGWLEYQLPVALRNAGRLLADDRVRMTHTQYVGIRGFALQYHAGRGFAGLVSQGRDWQARRALLARAFRIPSVLVRQTRDALRQRPTILETPWCLAVVAIMAACNAAGQVVGALRGTPGNSPGHLE
jgi:hypothetical protein